MAQPSYIVRREVPILDQHRVIDDNGRTIFDITPRRLEQIAFNMNRRVHETGDLAPVVIGHTSDERAEEDQPDIVGYAKEFSVGPLMKTGRLALKCTMLFDRKHIPRVKKYPRRSVELWLRRLEVDPISLLGATAPERNLGMLHFHRKREPSLVIRYRREDNMAGDSSQMVQEVLAAVEQTDTWKRLNAFLDQMEGGQEEEPEEGDMSGEYAQHEVPDAEHGGMPPEEELDTLGDDEVPAEEEPRRDYAAGSGAGAGVFPSGSNTYVPRAGMMSGRDSRRRTSSTGTAAASHLGGAGRSISDPGQRMGGGRRRMSRREAEEAYLEQIRQREEELEALLSGEEEPFQPARRRFSRREATDTLADDSVRIRFSRLERSLRSLQGENRELRVLCQRAIRERDLIQLEAEGVQMNRDEELNDVQETPLATYRRYLDKMRRNYSRAPLGGAGVTFEGSRNGAPAGAQGQGKSRAEVDQIVEMATQQGISFAEASARMQGQNGSGRTY